jgi:hypothetical protein
VSLREMLLLKTNPQSIDSVHTGQNQPIVCVEFLQRGVQRLVGTRRTNLDKGNLDDLGPQLAQAGG